MLIDTRRMRRVTTEYCRLQECITVRSEEHGVVDTFWQGVNEVVILPQGRGGGGGCGTLEVERHTNVIFLSSRSGGEQPQNQESRAQDQCMLIDI